MSRNLAALGLAAMLVPLGMTLQTAQAEEVSVGTLKCDVEGGVGMILGSKKDMTCTFEKKDGPTETYTGNELTIGADIGVTKESHIVWEVLAPSKKTQPGALQGNYVGLTAEATVAGGVGANVLVGGGDKSFSLQPLSVGTQKGLNVAAGIGRMKLVYKPDT